VSDTSQIKNEVLLEVLRVETRPLGYAPYLIRSRGKLDRQLSRGGESLRPLKLNYLPIHPPSTTSTCP